MKTEGLKREILLLLGIKFVLYIISLLSENFLGTWDDSTDAYLFGGALEDDAVKQTKLDKLIRKLVSPKIKWDALYFVHIAEKGYTHEKIRAFFPLFPLLMRVISKGFFFLTKRTAIVLSGLLLSDTCNIMAAAFLYLLTLGLFKNKLFAQITLFFYGIAPASVFTSALYTEPLFALFTFSGLYFLFIHGATLIATILFIASSGVRSNGVINAMFVFFYTVTKAFKVFWPQLKIPIPTPSFRLFKNEHNNHHNLRNKNIYYQILIFFSILILGALECVSICIPSIWQEENAFHQMCLSEAKVTIKQDGQFIEAEDSISKYDYIPSILQRYIRRFFMTFKIWPIVKKFIPKTIIGDWSAIEIDQNSMDINQIGNQVHLNFSRDWCIPNIGSDGKVNNGMIYPYVQSKYWNVGLFKYYQMKQLPNFLLAAPIIFLSCSAIYSFIKAQIRKTGANDVPKEKNHFPFNSISIIFVLQLFIMLMTFPILHIQVMTRFLNSCPVLFWHFAHILQSTIIQRNERKIDNKSKKANDDEEKKKIRTRKIRLGLLLFYCIGYCIIGHIMFAMFQPWT